MLRLKVPHGSKLSEAKNFTLKELVPQEKTFTRCLSYMSNQKAV